MVDDDATLLKVFTRVLERAGYQVVNHLDGAQALARLRSEAIDGIVTDLVMPGMSGLEFVQQVRASDPEMPLVVVTGTPGFDSAVRAIDFGVFRYVTKPVKNHELVRAVSDAVHARALAKARKAAFGQMARDVQHDPPALERALEGAWLAMQPIVSERQRSVIAYEALLRSNDSVLRDPVAILLAAERLGQLQRVGLARDLGIEVVAEGVETPAEMRCLTDLGLDLLQGYLFARPSPPFPHAYFPPHSDPTDDPAAVVA